MRVRTDRFDLTGRTATVTGGAGLLGRISTNALADHGAAVTVLDVDGGGAEEVERALRGDGAEAHAITCDVADPDEVEAAAAEGDTWHGPAHVLVNNAATKTDDVRAFSNDTAATDLERWRKAMTVNLDGMSLAARAFGGPHGCRRSRAHRHLAVEWAPAGVAVFLPPTHRAALVGQAMAVNGGLSAW
jgi:NAD(P)-dependent dehydrogenase (short-subunit alcohol dehydrogenase family)